MSIDARAFLLGALVSLLSCTAERPSLELDASEALDAVPAADAAGSIDAGPGEIAGLGLFVRLAGLWAGPASNTPLGEFPMLPMDLRPVGGHVLFSRADIDADNALRFAFSIETHDGKDVVVFRNGGLFRGVSRDSRTVLIESSADRFRFCHVDRGCAYIDAIFTFTSPNDVELEVAVREHPHLLWRAHKKEARTVPMPFPIDPASQGTGDAPFPPMPTLDLAVHWTRPLTAPADVWVFLTTQPCLDPGSCALSRAIKTEQQPGDTAAQLRMEQVHPGQYYAMALVDRDRNIAGVFIPSSGDGLSLPTALTVLDQASNTASLSAGIDFP